MQTTHVYTYINSGKNFRDLPGIFFVICWFKLHFVFFRQNCFQQKRFSCYWNYNCFSTSTNLTSAKKMSSILPNGMKRNINQPKFFPEIFGGPIFPSFKKRLPTILEGGKNLLKGGFSAFTWSNQSFGAKDLPFGKWVGSTLGLLGAVGSPELKLPI